MEEIWKPIKGYEGIYEVSNLGRIKSLDRIIEQKNKSKKTQKNLYKGKIIKIANCKKYNTVGLHKNGICRRFQIHRLVADSFIPKQEGKKYINHKDGNIKNNKANNLEWCTQSENIKYAYDIGRKNAPNRRKVKQYDLSHKLINIFESETEAERQTGIQQANIYKVCKGKRKQAGGFVWEYTE